MYIGLRGSHSCWVRNLILSTLLVAIVGGCHKSPPRLAEAPSPLFENKRYSQDRDYTLRVGDVLEFLYFVRPDDFATLGEYKIQPSDLLNIEFFYSPEQNRTVVVRPDGRITVPVIGDVMAGGRTPAQIDDYLTKQYQGIFRDPEVTIFVERFFSRADEIREWLDPERKVRNLVFPVQPDGNMSLPIIGQIYVFNRTMEDLQKMVRTAYDNAGLTNVDITIFLRESMAEQYYVFGEVMEGGVFPMYGDITVTQAISSAKGHLLTANMSSVILIRRRDDGVLEGRRLDIRRALKKGDFRDDIYLRPYDVIYVPKTFITHVDQFIDQYLTLGLYAVGATPTDLYLDYWDTKQRSDDLYR